MGHGYKMQRSIQVIATIVPTAVVLYLASMSCMPQLGEMVISGKCRQYNLFIGLNIPAKFEFF